jgi:hypothetical protein
MNEGYKQETKRNRWERIMKENNNSNLIEIICYLILKKTYWNADMPYRLFILSNILFVLMINKTFI